MVYKIIKCHWPPALLLLVFLKSFHTSNPSTRLCEPPQLDAPASLHLPQAVLKTDMLRRKKYTHSRNLGMSVSGYNTHNQRTANSPPPLRNMMRGTITEWL